LSQSDLQKYQFTLQERILSESLANKSLRHLPIPKTTDTFSFVKVDEPLDLVHWESLPDDVKCDDRARMHDFFFGTDKSAANGARPQPLTSVTSFEI